MPETPTAMTMMISNTETYNSIFEVLCQLRILLEEQCDLFQHKKAIFILQTLHVDVSRCTLSKSTLQAQKLEDLRS